MAAEDYHRTDGLVLLLTREFTLRKAFAVSFAPVAAKKIS
jgi:hypothetical protein